MDVSTFSGLYSSHRAVNRSCARHVAGLKIMKKMMLLFVCGLAVLLFSFSSLKHECLTKEAQGSYFKESGEFGRLDFKRTDNQFISLGKVIVTIEQIEGRFKLFAINDNVVKMDPKHPWGENGEVRDWPD